MSEVADFGRFFCLNPAQFAGFDYIGGFQELCGLLQENGIAPFLPEAAFCWEGLKDKKEFYDAYLFLESIRHRLEKPALLQDKLAGLCEDGEYFLSVFLSALAFLANYQLLTVRDIILCNYRHREAEYRHYLGRLNAHTEARLGLFREPRVFKDFLDSDSIVLLKNLGHLRPYLNLTPFYIDKNAFARDKQSIPAMDLFTFAYCNGGEYIYVKSSSNLLQSPAQGHNLLSTSLEISQDNRNRRLKSKYLLSRHEPGSRPFLVLEEQFEKLKTA
ncbi:MAG: hypothetical protein KDC66_09155 [Phaeodactylibacter sp.]|nr:hypothetical protein [Phaeodactylibacter sp.]